MTTIKRASTITFAFAALLFAAGSISAAIDDTANKDAPQNKTAVPSAEDNPATRPPGPRPGFSGYGRSGEHRRRPGAMPPGGPSMDRDGPQRDRDGRPGREGTPGPGSHGPFGKGRPSGTPRWPYHNWDSMQKADPEMYKLLVKDRTLEHRTRELGMQYRQAPEDQRKSIRKELVKAVDEHFEVRQQRRLLELKRLEEELKRLREAIERRSKARKEISARRIAELLGEDDLNF